MREVATIPLIPRAKHGLMEAMHEEHGAYFMEMGGDRKISISYRHPPIALPVRYSGLQAPTFRPSGRLGEDPIQPVYSF
jgi:hypothetical protein